MKVLTTGVDLDDFFMKLEKEKHNSVLFLDYDGTLAPFTTDRDNAVPYPGVVELLDKIIGSDVCRVVFITGRKAKDLLKLLNLKKFPEIWGSHGWERLMPDNRYFFETADPDAEKTLNSVQEWLKREELFHLCEKKPAGIALHWRGKQESEIRGINKRVKRKWVEGLLPDNLIIKDFDGGIEFMLSGKNKGFAVKQIISETRKDAITAYLGDDLTDEDAFRALGDRGLKVLLRDHMRPTNADVYLSAPEELLLFLKAWMKACLGSSHD